MSEVQPSTDTNINEPLKVVLVDQSYDAESEARDLADARLDRELGEGGRFKRFINGIWKGNIAKDYYRQKYIHTELATIRETNSVPLDRASEAKMATIERFTSEYDELIHTTAGERREQLDDQNDLSVGIKKIIRDFAEGRLNEESLHEERTRLLNDYRAQHGPDALGKGIVTTDNLLEIAKSVVGSLEYADSLERASQLESTLSSIQVVTGEARNGARTEAKYNTVDKIIDKLAKNKITSIITPGTLAVGVAAAASIARMGSHSVVGAVTKTLIPGVAAGAWAGLRENRRVKDERAQHAREMATGGQFDEVQDKRRIEMEGARYETISAVDLITHLQSVSDNDVLESGSDALQAALDALAAVQARVNLSDSKRIDLISYSSKSDVGEERMMLDLARREARLAVEARLTDGVRAELNLGPRADVRGLIEQRALLAAQELTAGEGGLTEKDKLFAKLKSKRVGAATAVGFATGLLGGLVTQEAVAAFDSTRFGLIDTLRGEVAVPSSDGSVHQTVLEGMFRGNETVVHTDASSTYDSYSLGSNTNIEITSDHSLVTNPDGTMDLKDGNGAIDVTGLEANEDGSLNQASLDKLAAAGMIVEDHSYDQEVVSTTTQTVSTEQYLQNHSAESTHVTRDLWYGNDTPGVYDQNELRVYRGGSDATPGIVEGGYQYTVAGMTADGSWQGGERVDWNQAASSGNLFVAVSGTEDSQGNPFMIPIGPNGEVNIPADSPAGHFFTNENNSVAFKGSYMEIVQTTGVDEQGVVHIRPLATLVGSSSVYEMQDTVTTSSIVHHAEYTITTNGFDTVQSNFTEMAPITPIASRRSLEAIESRILRGEASYYYEGADITRREREQLEGETSPRLRDNPEAELNLGQELGWFADELRRRKPEGYVSDLTAFVDNDPVLRSLSNNTEAIVTIPVAAASEADNIYGTLSLYAQQDPEGVSRSTILLNVNWLDTAIDDPEKVTLIQKTINEIERARRDFPQLAISVMQKEYNEAEVSSTGGVIGYVAEDMINVALLAAQRRVATGAIDSDHNLIIVRGDADADGLARTQLRNFQRTANDEKNIDIIKGATRFGTKESVSYPGFGIVSSFMTSFSILSSKENRIHTGGANFAVRASTLAAMGGLGDMLVADRESGHLVKYTGAGSDDVQIGNRVREIRKAGEAQRAPSYNPQSSYGSAGGQNDSGATKRIKVITGATADTNAARLLNHYLAGRLPQYAWNRVNGGFADGPAGYRERTEPVNNGVLPDRERIEGSQAIDMIEKAMTFELRTSSVETGKRALSLLFAGAPGAYRITPSSRGIQFKLTDTGREFIKKRVERELNGKFGSFGKRKMRQLYGITPAEARRRPASEVSPLVSPLR